MLNNLTNEEIKKAFNKFKNEAKKELSFSLKGKCYMNSRQLEKRTATIRLEYAHNSNAENLKNSEYEEIVNSECFKKFCNTVGNVTTHIEIDSDNWYQLRINY